jgi:hypothetical protein
MINRIEALAKVARPRTDDDWGSARQVDAENKFFRVVKQLLEADEFEALEDYCLKATTDEMIDKALRLVRAKFGVRS